MKIILTGATGMVGEGVLLECLATAESPPDAALGNADQAAAIAKEELLALLE